MPRTTLIRTRSKAIADAEHRLDEIGFRAIAFELAPQVHHVCVDRAVERVVLQAKGALAEVGARPRASGVRRQHFEEPELGGRHRHDRTVAAHFARRQIDLDVTGTDDAGPGRARRSTVAIRATSSRGLNGLVT